MAGRDRDPVEMWKGDWSSLIIHPKDKSICTPGHYVLLAVVYKLPDPDDKDFKLVDIKRVLYLTPVLTPFDPDGSEGSSRKVRTTRPI